MTLPDTSGRSASAYHTCRWLSKVGAGGALLLALLLSGCKDSTGPSGGDASLTGTVRATGTSVVLADASISVGTRSTKTNAAGQFELTGVPVGAASVRVTRPGYEDAVVQLNLVRGANSHDFSLGVKEIYRAGAIAALVPAGPEPIRAVILALGGPDVSGFVTGERIAPADRPAALEASLQDLGASLRALARSRRVALVGSSDGGMASSAENDRHLLDALRNVSVSSGHAEIAEAPLLLVGISGGSREAAGLVSRHPERSVGLLVRVPSSVASLTAPEALAVPTFVIQGEDDTNVDNVGVRMTFSTNRSRHGLWALVAEPGVGHQNPTSEGNSAQVGWMQEVLAQRLPAAAGDPLVALAEESGWLGNMATLEVSSWPDFTADKTKASWLLSQSSALTWQSLGTDDGGGGGR